MRSFVISAFIAWADFRQTPPQNQNLATYEVSGIPRLEALINLMATASEDPPRRIETESSEFEAVIQRVASDISLLYQLSNTIRKAGRESQNSKATSLFEIQDAEGNNIEKILEARFLHNLTDKFPGCNEQLRQRLAATILLRRKRIMYRRSRRPKDCASRISGWQPEPEGRQTLGVERSIVPVELKQQKTGPAETHTLKRKPSMVQSQVRTAETTTTLDPERPRPPIAPSILSMAKTIPLNSHDDLVFPPSPRAAVVEWFHKLKTMRRARHKARLRALPNYAIYDAYNGEPTSLTAEDVSTLRTQIKEAERDLQMGIDADLKMCKNTETEVLCPYCLCALSSTDMKSKEKWRYKPSSCRPLHGHLGTELITETICAAIWTPTSVSSKIARNRVSCIAIRTPGYNTCDNMLCGGSAWLSPTGPKSSSNAKNMDGT